MKELEKELRRLEKFNLLAQMAAGMAHEIRNPMTTVRGFLQFLKDKEEQNHNYEYYDLMISELDRANDITTEFLSLSRTQECKFEKRNLNDIIDAIYPLLISDAFAGNVQIQLLKGDIPDLQLNANQIRQLIYNLVRNSIEAMASCGVLEIKTFKNNKEVILTVKDNGQGIPSHLLAKIGDPFFTTKVNGTGIGLATCHSIAQRHHAVIEIESDHAGTKVMVKFRENPYGDGVS